jgi:hypothetical protein
MTAAAIVIAARPINSRRKTGRLDAWSGADEVTISSG